MPFSSVSVQLSALQQKKLAKAVSSLMPLSLKLKNSQLSGSHQLKVTASTAKKIEARRQSGQAVTISLSKTVLKANGKKGGWIQTALTVLPVVQEALKDDSTNKLLDRLAKLKEQDGNGAEDWKTVGDSAKFIFTNPTEGFDLLGRELKNLVTGNFKNSEKKYRLPPGVPYTKGMDFKKIGTEVKGGCAGKKGRSCGCKSEQGGNGITFY